MLYDISAKLGTFIQSHCSKNINTNKHSQKKTMTLQSFLRRRMRDVFIKATAAITLKKFEWFAAIRQLCVSVYVCMSECGISDKWNAKLWNRHLTVTASGLVANQKNQHSYTELWKSSEWIENCKARTERTDTPT